MFRTLLARFLAALLLLSASVALAQTPSPVDAFKQRLDGPKIALDAVQSTLLRQNLDDPTLTGLRTDLEPLAPKIQKILDELNQQIATVKVRLSPPAKPDDTPDQVAQRNDQQKLFDDLSAQANQAQAMQTQIQQLAEAISTRRHDLFARAHFEQGDGIFSPSLWRSVARELPNDLMASQVVLGDWLSGARSKLGGLRLLRFVTTLLFIGLLYWPVITISRRVMRRDPKISAPTKLQKVLAAIWVAAVSASIPISMYIAVSYTFDTFHLLNSRFEPLGREMSIAVVRVSLAIGIARGLLSPKLPTWRLLDLTDPVIKKLRHLALTLAVVISITKILDKFTDIIFASLPVPVAIRGIGALAVALIMAGTLKGILGTDPHDDPNYDPRTESQRNIFAPIRLAAWSAIAIVILADVSGYVAFASFIADQVAWITLIGCLLYMFTVLAEEGITQTFKPHGMMGRAILSSIGLKHETLEQISALTSGALRLALIVMAVMLLLLPWGIQSDDMFGYMRNAFFGFKVGDVTISLSAIVIGVLLFAVGAVATRGFQNWFEVRFLPHTQLDLGLRNSIKTSIGYVGYMMALSLGLSYMGLSFEKLTYVLSALSVGIGFGLQSVVNNFVSGLILLWERAIRVGDWIVVGDEQGYVRRINVRSTEIETFDRATVVVPNSSLVTGVVKNLLRSDRVGRVVLPIGVSHRADPDKVREILIECAKAHDLVLSIPAPIVLFTAITDTVLRFELICFCEDVEKGARTRSDLSFAIFKRLKDADIAMPYNDVTVRGLEQFGRALGQGVQDAIKPKESA
ncbi:DUF3772 domain-containing protein [Methylovirgula sp. 4M-Z18]|uniref:DUF3772 domain-containing protein n=1 Tax=Methylovirgula sp. 4M-Z18 TaxID=2293567 RepID=UPI00131467FD|nr:DUF3772 domain-containing protein [Methylovirgula sp. 4M-Z18]